MTWKGRGRSQVTQSKVCDNPSGSHLARQPQMSKNIASLSDADREAAPNCGARVSSRRWQRERIIR
jgi:hypothetical protein